LDATRVREAEAKLRQHKARVADSAKQERARLVSDGRTRGKRLSGRGVSLFFLSLRYPPFTP
jgi:hypothetical protein